MANSGRMRNKLPKPSRKLGVILSYCLTISQVAVNLVYVPLLLGGIGRDEYGLYQLIGSLIAYMSVMNTMFAAGVTRYYCKALADDDIDQANSVLAAGRRIYNILTLVIVLLGFIAAQLFVFVYSEALNADQLQESVAMLVVLIANLIITMHNTLSVAVITGRENFAFLKGSQLVMTILQPIGVVAVIQQWPYAICIPCVHLFLNACVILAQRFYAWRVLGGIPKASEDIDSLTRNLVRFSGGVVMVLVADMVFWRTNQLILGYVSGVADVAVYGIAYQLYTAYPPLGTAVSSVFMPQISRLWHADHDIAAISSLFCKVGRLSSYVLLFVLGGFIVFGQDFINLWAGSEYVDAYLIALVFMACQFVDLSQNLGLTILQVTNRYSYRGVIYLSMAATNIVLVAIVAPIWGGVGCAVISGTCLLVANGPVMNRYYARHVGLDIKRFWAGIMRMVAPLAILASISYCLWSGYSNGTAGWAPMLLGMAVYTICYIVVAWVFSMNQYEKQLACRGLRKVARITPFGRRSD